VNGDAFRDALAVALEFWGDDGAGVEMLPDDDGADAILAMPEMQAIRTHLFLTHAIAPSGLPRDPALVRRIMAGCGLPESVIDWVLGGPS
jgi:hypothetical protein